MGIKFHCPKGHKLNVKSFLAGKKGVCPKCGAKMRIPTASEPALANSELVDNEVDEEDGEAAHHPAKSNGSGAVAAPAVSAATAAGQNFAAISGDDPIAEAPAAIWYVRPPSGGQYGPARGEIMRRWIAEGRVSSDSLVWREGWTDWQNAGKLFPVLHAAGTAAAPATATPAVSTTVPISARSSIRTATRYQEQKRETSSLAIGILVSLGVVCLALVGVLVYVLSHLK